MREDSIAFALILFNPEDPDSAIVAAAEECQVSRFDHVCSRVQIETLSVAPEIRRLHPAWRTVQTAILLNPRDWRQLMWYYASIQRVPASPALWPDQLFGLHLLVRLADAQPQTGGMVQ